MGEPHIDTSNDTVHWGRPPLRLLAPANVGPPIMRGRPWPPRGTPKHLSWDDITAVKWRPPSAWRGVASRQERDDCIRVYEDTNYLAKGGYYGELTVVYESSEFAQEGNGDYISEAWYERGSISYTWEWQPLWDDPKLEITWDRIASVPWKAIHPRRSISPICVYSTLKDTALTGILTLEYATDKARQMHYWAPGTIRWAEYHNSFGSHFWEWPMDR